MSWKREMEEFWRKKMDPNPVEEAWKRQCEILRSPPKKHNKTKTGRFEKIEMIENEKLRSTYSRPNETPTPVLTKLFSERLSNLVSIRRAIDSTMKLEEEALTYRMDVVVLEGLWS